MRFALFTTGCGLLITGSWMIYQPLAFVVGGVSVLALSLRTDAHSNQTNQ